MDHAGPLSKQEAPPPRAPVSSCVTQGAMGIRKDVCQTPSMGFGTQQYCCLSTFVLSHLPRPCGRPVFQAGKVHCLYRGGALSPGSNSICVDHSTQPHSPSPALSPVSETSTQSLTQSPWYLHSRMEWGFEVALGEQRHRRLLLDHHPLPTSPPHWLMNWS